MIRGMEQPPLHLPSNQQNRDNMTNTPTTSLIFDSSRNTLDTFARHLSNDPASTTTLSSFYNKPPGESCSESCRPTATSVESHRSGLEWRACYQRPPLQHVHDIQSQLELIASQGKHLAVVEIGQV